MLKAILTPITSVLRCFTSMFSCDKFSYLESMETERLNTIQDYLNFWCKTLPDRNAFVFAHTDGTRTVVTFKELYENSNILAKAFLKLGVTKGEVIANTLRSCPEWLYVTFGAILAGVRPIGLSFTYTDGSDVISMMKKLESCSAIILDPAEDVDTWKIFQRLITKYDANGQVQSNLMPYLRYLICRQKPSDGNVLTLGDLMNWKLQDVTLPSASPDDIVILFQTSGSTGVPKAVAHTNRSFLANVKSFSDQFLEEEWSVMFNDRPFTWVGGCPWNVVTGQTRVTRYGYGEPPDNLIEFSINLIEREGCTFLLTLPPLLHSFMEEQGKIGPDWPVQVVGCGGQPVSQKFAGCIGKLCRRFFIGYGATECAVICGLMVENPDDFQEYSIGYPFKGVKMRICDDDGNDALVNQRGEIYVKCEGMFSGYYNDKEKTKAVFTEDGWFKTDDIGFVTENGLFFCEGRKSEMIISGGMNVAPTILEAVMQNCPGVSRVVCVPVAHDVMYQVICACLITEEGSNVTEKQLRRYCEAIHNDKPRLFTALPTYYMFLKELPETYTGKISRKELTKMATDKFKTA